MAQHEIYSSKTLGGLVVESAEAYGTFRAILRNDGTGSVYYKPADSDKFLIHSYGKKGRAWGIKMLEAAKASYQ